MKPVTPLAEKLKLILTDPLHRIPLVDRDLSEALVACITSLELIEMAAKDSGVTPNINSLAKLRKYLGVK